MPDFLLELRSEEIPARMQAKARDDLARLFLGELAVAGLKPASVATYATPRRLALIARDLPAETESVSDEVKGPRASAPPQALEGFLRKTGLTRDQLVDRDGVLFAVIDKPGRATTDVLAQAIPAIIRAFPWPKSMRWGAASVSTESPRWVRPLHGVVALFGEDVVACEVAGVASGAATVGHRFHHPGPITLGGAHDYVEKLRACHVIVDQDERAVLIRTRAAELARDAGLDLIEDEGLVAENAGLTEWPVPLLGRFDEAFLEVPPEVIQLTARVNQKYFVCRREAASQSEPWDGRLADAFICTANIAARDGGAKIVEGNRKVLAARLSDARFFYETDLKTPLEEQAKKLDRIVFHEKLGTVADKVDRVAKLARWLVEKGIVRPASLPLAGGAGGGQGSPVRDRPSPDPSREREGREELAHLAERAARLCKADLVTGMVGEFPELQGLMGGYYAAAQGERPAVAEAIRDHYKPAGQGDEVPTAPVTVAVSLADKLDTLAAFFSIKEKPTGSKDPFALRRAMLGVMALVIENGLRLSLRDTAYYAALLRVEGAKPMNVQALHVPDAIRAVAEDGAQGFLLNIECDANFVYDEFPPFLADRLKVQQREAGVRHDLIDAVFALGGEDDLVRLLARVRALQAFVGREDGANLLSGYKRAANILKKEGWTGPAPLPLAGGAGGGQGGTPEADPPPTPPASGRGEEIGLSYTPEPEEAQLATALDSAEPMATAAIGREDFEGAMTALASLRAPIDAFFDKVTVNDPDPARRESRLALLARVRAAVHNVADFSRIEG